MVRAPAGFGQTQEANWTIMTPEPGSPSPLRGPAFAALGFALFATHDAIIKTLGAVYPVFQIIFFTLLFAFIPMSMIILADRAVDNFRPHHPWLILIRSVLMIIAMSSAFYAFTTLPLAEVYSLLFAIPLLITALSVPLLGETVRAQRWAAVVVGLLGVIIIVRPGLIELSLGHLAALTAAVASALSSIVVRKIGREERSAVLILYPMLMSMIGMGAMLPTVYIPVDLVHLGLMAGAGFLSIGAQLCIIAAYRSATAAVVAPIQYTQIIWATAFGMLLFAERPDIYVGVGSTIIILSGLFVVWRETRTDVSARNPVLGTSNPRFDTGPSPKPKQQKPETD